MREPEARSAILAAGFLLLVGVVFYCIVEGWTFVDSLYFCVTTLTTVGFGNPAPSTDLGKLFTVFFVLAGVGMFLAVINGLGKAAVQNARPRFTRKPIAQDADPMQSAADQAGAGEGSFDPSDPSD